ncbi:hypothetical protein niasHT_009828 [Heterodera trifolii]|uniref:14-3-3 domain-containing protein n=1 Tax=Heterodera trifolii TaxID=157864 RepID=A0ABD2LRC3_9BILA
MMEKPVNEEPETKEELAYLVNVCKKAERYDDMVDAIKKLIKLDANLSVEERIMLSIAYDAVTDARRSSWRALFSTEDVPLTDAKRKELCCYRVQVKTELMHLCQELLTFINDLLFPKATDAEAKVFYLKMKADYHRHMAELVTDDDRTGMFDLAKDAYEKAMDIATDQIAPTDPIRLGLANNFSMFHYEVLKSVDDARKVTKNALALANAEILTFAGPLPEDVTNILSMMKDNMQLWTPKEMANQAKTDVTESAEREESWKTEREELKSELIKAKSRSEMGEINEAFREEIEALTAENAQMKQMGRERDGEMAKMGERTEQLEERLRGAERENALLISNQAQLEDSIRELNRRLNTQSEAKQQGAEWEARKLRQRNEQAMVLSEQVRELAAQNDELREEIDRLSGALDEANGLLKENTARFSEFNEQFEEAEKQLERLRSDNGQLRKIMEEKEKALKERTLNVQMSSREFVEVVQEKDTLLEKQRVQLQQTKAELEQCRLSLETAIRPNEQREEELDRLRVELINATEAARKLFGVETLAGEEQMDDGDAARAEGAARELRLRMIQMDQQLEQQERSLAQKQQTEHETEQALEQKDLQIARLLTECQRYRKMAFGDAEGQMARIEKQLEYRNKQIEQLNRRCSELQIELEQYIGEEEHAEKQRKEKKGETEEGGQMAKRKRVTIREEEGKEEEAEESMDEEETEEEKEEEEEEEEYREEIIEEWEEEEEEEEEEEKTEEKEKREEMEEKRETERTEAKEGRKRQTEKQTVVRRRKSREQLLREATDVQALHGEITRLIGDLKQTEEELNLLRKQYNERGKFLKEEREAKAKARLDWR